MGTRWFSVLIVIVASGLLVSAATTDCSFLKNPDEYLINAERRQRDSVRAGQEIRERRVAAGPLPAPVLAAQVPAGRAHLPPASADRGGLTPSRRSPRRRSR